MFTCPVDNITSLTQGEERTRQLKARTNLKGIFTLSNIVYIKSLFIFSTFGVSRQQKQREAHKKLSVLSGVQQKTVR